MSIAAILIMTQLGALLFMAGLGILSHLKKDAGVIDLGWTLGLGFAVIWLTFFVDGYGPRVALVAFLVSAWAFRLAYHMLFHRILGHEEDRRYRRLREHWGDRAPRYFFIGFLAESFLIILFAIPCLVAMQNPQQGFTWWDGLGVLIWVVANAGETMADRQLETFRSNPDNKGKTCRSGLWRYSRHPNYFFEWVHWWAYVALAIGAPHAAWSLVGPVLMFIFLFKITGIPHTEKQALASRGEDYRRYQETTNIFFPWFPKKEA